MSSDDEFDAVASWTVEAIEELGTDHAVPGACRGSGGPGALTWLADWLLDGRSGRFLDLGGGIGGPSAWLSQDRSVASVLAEPMAGAVSGARQLFGLAAVQADGASLPFAGATFTAAWCLGVLSTAPDPEALLHEAARMVGPGGQLGLVAYISGRSSAVEEPEGNRFPTGPELDATLAGAGFEIVAQASVDDLASDHPMWDERADAVDEAVAARHRSDARWQRADAGERHVARLLGDGQVVGTAIRARRS